MLAISLDHPDSRAALGSMLGQIGLSLGLLSWAHVGPMLAYVGSMLALYWPMLALSWALGCAGCPWLCAFSPRIFLTAALILSRRIFHCSLLPAAQREVWDIRNCIGTPSGGGIPPGRGPSGHSTGKSSTWGRQGLPLSIFASCSRWESLECWIPDPGTCQQVSASNGPNATFSRYVGPVLALCWPYVGLCWPHVGPSWAMLKLCWRYVRPSLLKGLQDANCFLPGPLRGTKNHVKTLVFFIFANRKLGSAEATKHRKKWDVFATSRAAP